ncbi:CD40 ligand [Nothobranchius furzeri]|uniref:Tumor necrosis factor ligand superfamily member 6-like n=2 Tax=Nothobranchius furzeri TaxID=105023 RepID=A0A9D2YXN7_NOTFU|nr:tumor necrosis factor ligand superfamily member 6-like [Nothobranchius furzeri]
MINTYQTSVAPPPVPPRYAKPQPVLIPAQLPAPNSGKPLIRFLVALVILHLLLSVGGFIYLFHQQNPGSSENLPSHQRQVGFLSAEKQEITYRALARMVATTPKEESKGYLQWDMKHSIRKNINYYRSSWLTILEPGDYFVYSRVTFSKSHVKEPLTSWVKMRKTEEEEEKVMMVASCSLSDSASSPQLCTASQGDLISLESGDQLSVWVPDLSLVNYKDGATVFGMYKL